MAVAALAMLSTAALAQRQDLVTVVEGRLTADDLVLPTDGSFYKLHEFPCAAGEMLVIDLISDSFDAYLYVHTPGGEILSDDDGGDDTNARVTMVGDVTGTVKVFASSLGRREQGAYTLRVRRIPAAAITTEAYTGRLQAGNPRLEDGRGYYREHRFDLAEGQFAIVDLLSNDFDAYLEVVSPSGAVFSDDDGGDGNNSRLVLTADEGGSWLIRAGAFSADDTGAYTGTIRTVR